MKQSLSYFYKGELAYPFVRAQGDYAAGSFYQFAMTKAVCGNTRVEGTNLKGPSTKGEVDNKTKHNVYYMVAEMDRVRYNENATKNTIYEKITIQDGDEYCTAELHYGNSFVEGAFTDGVSSNNFIVTGANGKFAGAKTVVVEYDNALSADWNKAKEGRHRRVTITSQDLH